MRFRWRQKFRRRAKAAWRCGRCASSNRSRFGKVYIAVCTKTCQRGRCSRGTRRELNLHGGLFIHSMSAAHPLPADESFGQRLRRERERRQIELSSIAENSKIKVSLFE